MIETTLGEFIYGTVSLAGKVQRKQNLQLGYHSAPICAVRPAHTQTWPSLFLGFEYCVPRPK